MNRYNKVFMIFNFLTKHVVPRVSRYNLIVMSINQNKRILFRFNGRHSSRTANNNIVE